MNWYQSIKIFSNWYWLVSVNQWSIENHTKTFHRLLSIGTATSNRHQARFLSDHLAFLGSPGDEIPIQSSQCKEHTQLHMYLNYPLAFPRHNVHAKSRGGGFIEYKVHHQRLSSLLRWMSMKCLTIDCYWKSIPINNHMNLHHRLVINYQYQSINWYLLVLIDIDCHRLSISSIGYSGIDKKPWTMKI